MKNNINILFFLGIVTTAVSLLFIFLSVEPYLFDEYRSIEEIGFIDAAIVVGFLVCLAGGIGLILRRDWARWLISIMACLIIVSWLFFISTSVPQITSADLITTIMASVCILSICLFVIMLLHNETVLSQGKTISQAPVDDAHILDAWEKAKSDNNSQTD